MPKPTTPQPNTPAWVTTTAIEPGRWVADAIKGRPANGPAEFRQVAEVELKGAMRRVKFTDGTSRTMGVATKLFVAQAKPNTKPEVTPVPKPSAAKRAAKATAVERLEKAVQDGDLTADEANTELAQPAGDRGERLRLAQVEHATLQAWVKDGERPPRPATPNLDAMNAEHAARGGRPRTQAPKAAKAAKAAKATLPEGAETATCSGPCGLVLPVTKFPKAVIDGKRQADKRATECRSCRDARRAAAKASAA